MYNRGYDRYPYAAAAGPSREVLWQEVQRLRQENQMLRSAHARQQQQARTSRPDPRVQKELQRLQGQTRSLEQELKRLRQQNQALEQRALRGKQQLDVLREQNARLLEHNAQLRQSAAVAPVAAPAEDAASLKDRVLRLSADIANLRRNHGEALRRSRQDAQAALLRDFVEALDVLETALDSHPDKDSPWVQGSEALRRKMQHILEQAGVERLGAPGEGFDPHIHEAVGAVPSPDVPTDHIVAVMQPGYRFSGAERADKLIRPARVIVAR
ncbi:MAG: nucleotide exchange factor GrpE [Myxococcota bacterium]